MEAKPMIAFGAGSVIFACVGFWLGHAAADNANESRQLDHGMAALKRDDGICALENLEPIAEAGNKSAARILGKTYALGWGNVDKNEKQAIEWFRKAGRHPLAKPEDGTDPVAYYEFEVAQAYLSEDRKTGPNPDEARRWLRLAAKGGHKHAVAMLESLAQ